MMLPLMTPLSHWAHSLIVDFPQDNIPDLAQDTKWKEWGNFLIQEPSFSKNNAPSPHQFESWEAWASALYSVMQDENS